jgi:hypothetical protein
MKRKILWWSPRILAILAILFMMMFSLDCFGENKTLKNQLICIFMHNIPALICVVVLIIAWKWELIGGILFIVTFIAAGIFFGSFTDNFASLIVISPFLVTGILFVIHFLPQKKRIV